MKKNIIKRLTTVLTAITLGFTFVPTRVYASTTPGIISRVYVQKQAWQGWRFGDSILGTTGKKLRAEALQIKVSGDSNLNVQYRVHVQKKGWMNWVNGGKVAGTTKQALRMEALKIKLTGSDAFKYDVYYRVHVQHYGWLDWACNGQEAGTSGLSYRIEAVQIKLINKYTPDNRSNQFLSAPFRGKFATPYISKTKVGRVNLKSSKVALDRAKCVSDSLNKLPYGMLWSFDRLRFGVDMGYYGKSWAGLFNSMDRKIYIENNTKMDLSVVTLHETGHFFDLLNNIASEEDDFDNIFNKERTNLVPMYKANYNYYTTNCKEYFAECFAQYMYNPNLLKRTCPATYYFIAHCLAVMNQEKVDYIGQGISIYNKENGGVASSYSICD